MEDNYLNNLSYATDLRSNCQRQEHYVNPLQEAETSETEFSMSERSTERERPIQTRTRLDSYEQAHVSREMLQQMQQSYLASTGSSHNGLFLDENSVVKKRTLRLIVVGLITILLLILIIVIGVVVALVFLFLQTELRFRSPTLAQVIFEENVNRATQDIEILFNIIQRFDENMNVSNEVFAVFSKLLTASNNFTAIETINTLIDELNQLRVTTQNNFSESISQLRSIQDELQALNHRVLSLENQLRVAQNDAISSNFQVNGLQTIINNITNQLSSPVNLYQNCQQDTSSCNITTFRDTRLFCSTSALAINIEVSNTMSFQ